MDHVATSLSEKGKMSMDKLKQSLIADQLLLTFPGYSNPFTTRVFLFQLIVQMETQPKGKQQKRKNW